MQLLDVLRDCRVVDSEARENEISEIHNAYLKCYDGDEEGDEKKRMYHQKFLNSTIRWSSALGNITHGAFIYHTFLADLLWDSSDHTSAITHYAFAEKPELINNKLATLMKRPTNADDDPNVLFAHSVLIMLTLENLRDANSLLTMYKNHLVKTECVNVSKYVIFCVWLLEISKKGKEAESLFQWLNKNFEAELRVNPGWAGFLTRIGKTFFEIKPAASMMNMLEQMLGGGM